MSNTILLSSSSSCIVDCPVLYYDNSSILSFKVKCGLNTNNVCVSWDSQNELMDVTFKQKTEQNKLRESEMEKQKD